MEQGHWYSIWNQGAIMFLSLEGEARVAALELEEDAISSKNSVKIALTRLDKLYKTDNTLPKFHALEVLKSI